MEKGAREASRLTAATFGVFGGLGSLRHGIGEMTQGPVRPEGVFIESWTSGPLHDYMGGEPGMTLLPNLFATGIVAALLSLLLVAVSLGMLRRRGGAVTMLVLSAALLLLGGGVGPPVMGLMASAAAFGVGGRFSLLRRLPAAVNRAIAALWPVLFVLAAAGGVFLVGVSLLLVFVFDVNAGDLSLGVFLATTLLMAGSVVAARARDLERRGGRAAAAPATP